MANRNRRGTYGRGGLLKAQSLGELRQEGIDAGYDVDAGIETYMKTGNLDAAVDAGGGTAEDAAMIDSYAEDNFDTDLDTSRGSGASTNAEGMTPGERASYAGSLGTTTLGHADYGSRDGYYGNSTQFGNGTPTPGATGTPYASSGYNYMTPTAGGTEDTTRIGDRFMRRAARKEGRNLMREMRQERRRDRREERQDRRADRRANRIQGRQERRDARQDARMDRRSARQERKMGRIDARSERQQARRDRRSDRKWDRMQRRSM